MSGSITDPAVFDPTTGTFVTAAQAAANAQKSQISDYGPTLNALRSATPAPPVDDFGRPVPSFQGSAPATPQSAPTPQDPSSVGDLSWLPSRDTMKAIPQRVAGAFAGEPYTGAPPAPPAPPPAALPGSGPDMGAQMGPQAPPPPAPAPAPQMSPAAASQGASGLQGYSPAPTLAGKGPEPLQASPQAPVAAPAAPTDSPSDGISGNARNNPLNLRFAGQDGATNVGGFAAFPTQEAGLAAAKNQFAINAGRGINTLTGLISSWAPPNENDTAAYIANVSKATGIAPDAKININDPAIQAKIIPAMSLMENGPAKKGSGPATPNLSLNSGTTNTTPTPPPPPATLPGVGASGLDPNHMDLSRFQSSPGDKLLALGAGLMSGPTLGLGMSKGLTAMNAMGAADRSEGLKTYSAMASAASTNARITAMMRPKAVGAPMMDPNDPTKSVQKMQDGTGAVYTIPLDGVTAAAYKAPSAVDGVKARTALTEAKTAGDQTPEQVAISKDNIKTIGGFNKTETTARTSLQNGADVLALLDKSGGDLTNPDFASKAKRYLAENFNINVGDITPSGLALAQKDIANLSNNSALTMTHGTVPRSQAEMATIQKGFGQPVMNADALRAVIQSGMAADQRTVEAGDSWRKLEAAPDTKKSELAAHGGMFSSWLNDHLAGNAATQQNITGTPGTQPTPQIQQAAPGSPWTHTTSGVRFKINH